MYVLSPRAEGGYDLVLGLAAAARGAGAWSFAGAADVSCTGGRGAFKEKEFEELSALLRLRAVLAPALRIASSWSVARHEALGRLYGELYENSVYIVSNDSENTLRMPALEDFPLRPEKCLVFVFQDEISGRADSGVQSPGPHPILAGPP